MLMLMSVVSGFSQVRPGIKFGLSTPDISPRDIVVSDPRGQDYYHILVKDARYGVHAGVFIQMQIGHFFIQPEMLYNSTGIDYQLDSLFTAETKSDLLRDTYRNIDFPILLGFKTGILRIGGGPVGHIALGHDGDLNEYGDYKASFDDLTWGWQAGIGFDLWKIHLDVRYEGNFNNFGDHITFFGHSYDFATRDNRMLASVGFSF